jgi:hypothetical protein
MIGLTHQHVAIIAFLLLLGTFIVGIRCFRDFDRGLQSSKVNCQHSFFLLSDLILKLKLSRSIPTRTYEPKTISKPVRSCERTNSSRPRGPSWSQDIHRMMSSHSKGQCTSLLCSLGTLSSSYYYGTQSITQVSRSLTDFTTLMLVSSN